MKALIVFDYWEPARTYTSNEIIEVPGGKLTAESVEGIKDEIAERRSKKSGLRGYITITNIIKLDQ